MALSSSFLVLASLIPGQPSSTDFYQDFRGGGSLSPSLSLFGDDPEAVVKPEAEGLRVTLPVDGKQTFGWGVSGRFALAGDFEVTASYELLTLDRPLRGGGGAGVALNVANDSDRNKWAKVGRFLVVQGESVHLAEVWAKKASPRDYKFRSVPTQARTGQLRVRREGSILHCLAAEGLGNDFREIYQGEFGTEDMGLVRFIVNNNSSPTAADVRLLDLKVHAASLVGDPASGPVSPLEEVRNTVSKGWLAAGLLLGLVVTLSFVGVGMWFYARHSRRAGKMPAGAAAEAVQVELEAALPPVSFRCPACGKRLKAKGESAGKKVKCPQCGKTVLIPEAKADESPEMRS